MSDHDPQHGTARWLVFCHSTVGLLLLAGLAGLKITEQKKLSRFQQLAPNMDSRRIYEVFGKPDRMWGSGILRYEYDIVGGRTVTITFHGLQPGHITYGGEVLFERRYPPPIDPVTISLSPKPMPTSDAWRKTLQANPPPKRVVSEP